LPIAVGGSDVKPLGPSDAGEHEVPSPWFAVDALALLNSENFMERVTQGGAKDQFPACEFNHQIVSAKLRSKENESFNSNIH
jgi:hypothetical protein